MFQFPEFALPALYIQPGVTGSHRTRFRIQKSSDRRLFASFPRLIAGCHVFRRLSMPRHSPCTLSNLTTFIDHRLDRSCNSELPIRSPRASGDGVEYIWACAQTHSVFNRGS